MSLSGPARHFGGRSPATGEPAQLVLDDWKLEVRTANGSLSSRLVDVRIRDVGTAESGLEFAWDTEHGPVAVQIFDRALLGEIRASRGLQELPQLVALRASRARKSVGRTIGVMALLVLQLLPLLVIATFLWNADRIAGAAAARISLEQEVALGTQLFAAMQGPLALQDSGPAYDAVRTIGERLTRGSRYAYRFHVATNPSVNAFAVPGGIVVVHTGLLQATKRPEELAGVVAHEVQHVELRHSLRGLVKQLGWRGLFVLMTGDFGSTLVGTAALELTSLRFSRDTESEADNRGFDDLVEAGIDPGGMADFFTVMAAKSGGLTPSPFLSTHPASAAREAALRGREKDIRGRTFQPLDLGPWPPVLGDGRTLVREPVFR